MSDCITDCAADLALDPEIAGLLLPKGVPLAAGARLRNGAYAETLKAIAAQGPGLLYGGALGKSFADDIRRHDGYLSLADLQAYRTNDLEVLRSSYRGFEITGPPPPCSGPLHIAQMLNILEGFDVAGAGAGSFRTFTGWPKC